MRYHTLRESLMRGLGLPARALWALAGRGAAPSPESTLWAVRGVGLEVRRGAVVGIIGRNGSGKSTLLKLLSQITEPTEGRVEIAGRVGTLLEVGTGFHPELTGRENVSLNGAILGMRRSEILRKFDEIVALAEVERFVDTPVKHYSSGMYLRLAFAVAAHLDPEVLLVDEVLAVGDGRFQRRCLDKMQAVGRQGRTVLFVSHNMPAITRMCPRTILLEQGAVLMDDESHRVVSAYLQSGVETTACREWPDASEAPGDEVARLRAVRVRDHTGEVSDSVDTRRPVEIEMEYEVLVPGRVLAPVLHFFNEEGVHAFVASDSDPSWRDRPRPAGQYRSTARIPGNLLAEGTLLVGAALGTMNPVVVHFYERDAVAFHVRDTMQGDSARGSYGGPMPGVLRPLLEWLTVASTDGGASERDDPPARGASRHTDTSRST